MRARWWFTRRSEVAADEPVIPPVSFRILQDPADLREAMQRAARSERRLAARIEARATWYDQRSRELAT